jgi:hypothetical protein
MIRRYDRFILDKAVSESALYISPELDEYLSKIDSPIAKDILSMAGSDIKPDVTFLDLGEKEGELTFATMRNAKKRLEELYHGDPEFVKSIEDPESRGHKGPGDVFWAKAAAKVIQTQHPEFWKASRNPARIGRLIGQIFPGKYSNPEIEKFVNQFKAAAKKEESFIMAEGEDINKWYWHENYLKVEGERTVLDIRGEPREGKAACPIRRRKGQRTRSRLEGRPQQARNRILYGQAVYHRAA